MSVFIKSDQEVKIEIFVAKDEKGRTVAYGEGIIPPVEMKLSDLKKHHITFRYPTYRDATMIADKGLSLNENGDMALHANQVRFKRIITLLKEWDFVDDEGNPVPPTEENVGSLDPLVAAAIVYALDRALGFIPDTE